MITSKLTIKLQTAVPQPVRAALQLGPGDELAYEIEDGKVILTKAPERRLDDPFRPFTEGNGDSHRKAYSGL